MPQSCSPTGPLKEEGGLKGSGGSEDALLALDKTELQRLVDVLYKPVMLHSPNRDVAALLKILTNIYRRTRSIPTQLRLSAINGISEHQFTGTATSDIFEASHGQSRVVLKTPRRALINRSHRDEIFYYEALLWSTVGHPNINRFLGLYTGPGHDVYMVSPYMSHGTLLDYLKAHPKANKIELLSKVACALAYLHGLPNPVLHGDIRGVNILVDDRSEPLLIDFGCSLFMDVNTLQFFPSLHRYSGSMRWMPGEKMRPGHPLTLKADSYAFACLCLEVFTGQLPFSHLKNDAAVVVEVLVRRKNPSRPQCAQLKDDLWDLMLRCWDENPHSRPSMEDIHRALEPMKAQMVELSVQSGAPAGAHAVHS